MSGMTVEQIRSLIVEQITDMSPQVRRAAQYVLDNPNGVAVNSIRSLATAAGVKPNTLVRMVQSLGFSSFEEFRQPFRENVSNGIKSFPDQARWLQSLAKTKSHGLLFSQMAAATLSNIEQLFSGTNADELRVVAKHIIKSRRTSILGLGTCYALAHGFWYVAQMALDNLELVSNHGTLPIDEVVKLGKGDVLMAISFDPYRKEIIQAVQLASKLGVTVVSITDSRASPLALAADYVFVAPTQTPQFFPSAVASAELLETLIAFIIAESDQSVIERINEFHRRRLESGVYHTMDN
jgi:DNA-binding MurR/RpiR family transcriptional regulator